jgi:hypothetical protein
MGSMPGVRRKRTGGSLSTSPLLWLSRHAPFLVGKVQVDAFAPARHTDMDQPGGPSN